MMLNIFCPNNRTLERTWILSALLDRFGVDYKLIKELRTDWKIKVAGISGSIFLADTIIPTIFNVSNAEIAQVDLHSVSNQHNLVRALENEYFIDADIFGMAFWAMSRIEETSLSATHDIHDRFVANSSLLYKQNLLDRPFIDEWMELLWVLMLKLWPRINRIKQSPKTIVSCDVDTPFEPHAQSLKKTLRKSGGDLIKRTNLPMAINTIKNYTATKFGDYSKDINNTFNWMMDVNEQSGNRVAFYFLVESTVPKFDATYNIDEPRIRQLMRTIYDRGHEIGLHGSYGTYKNGKQLKRQFAKLRRVMDEENIVQEEIGIRQHYLRWSTSETPSNMEEAGLTYDTTLGFADHAGFRCGTCFEYPLFDLKNRKQLKIIERPLVAMECAVLDDVYMGLKTESATKYLQQLKKSTKQVNGNFTLLWHNSYFKNNIHRQIYENLI